MGMNFGKLIKTILGWAVVLATGYYLSRIVFDNWGYLKHSQINVNCRYLLLSFLPLSISFYIGISAWRYILKIMGYEISWRKSFWTVSGSHLAKFIPGHIVALGGRIWLCKRENIPESIAGTGLVLEMIVQLAASIMVFCLTAFYWIGLLSPALIAMAFVVMAFLILAAHPRLLALLWKYTPARFAKIKAKRSYSFHQVIILLFAYAAAWALQGGSVFLLIKSIYPEFGYGGIGPAMGAYGGGYALGFVSMVTPGGLGIREGVLSYLLKYFIPLPVAVVASVLIRLCFTAFDVLMTVISLKYYRRTVTNEDQT